MRVCSCLSLTDSPFFHRTLTYALLGSAVKGIYKKSTCHLIHQVWGQIGNELNKYNSNKEMELELNLNSFKFNCSLNEWNSNELNSV